MASSLFTRFSFDADGREHELETSQGETMKVVAELKENALTIRAKSATNAALEAVSPCSQTESLRLVKP
jgi:hypothetical protein